MTDIDAMVGRLRTFAVLSRLDAKGHPALVPHGQAADTAAAMLLALKAERDALRARLQQAGENLNVAAGLYECPGCAAAARLALGDRS